MGKAVAETRALPKWATDTIVTLAVLLGLFNGRYMVMPFGQALGLYIRLITNDFADRFVRPQDLVPCPEGFKCWSKNSTMLEYPAWMVERGMSPDWPDFMNTFLVMHISSAVFTVLGQHVQLVGWIRERHAFVHRWLGYAVILSWLASITTAFPYTFLGYNDIRGGGILSSIGLMQMSATATGAMLIGLWHIRNGDVKSHKEWMLRSYGALNAFNFTARYLLFVPVLIYRLPSRWRLPIVYNSAHWLGIGLVELYIRRQRRLEAKNSKSA